MKLTLRLIVVKDKVLVRVRGYNNDMMKERNRSIFQPWYCHLIEGIQLNRVGLTYEAKLLPINHEVTGIYLRRKQIFTDLGQCPAILLQTNAKQMMKKKKKIST